MVLSAGLYPFSNKPVASDLSMHVNTCLSKSQCYIL